MIVTLNDDGHLQCSYLGTDPSLFQAPKVEARDINYEDYDAEMNKLQKIIKEATKTKGTLFQFMQWGRGQRMQQFNAGDRVFNCRSGLRLQFLQSEMLGEFCGGFLRAPCTPLWAGAILGYA